MMEIKLEYLGEDKEFPDAKNWKFEAIHVTTTRNKRKFTLDELTLAGRSLSFRPLNRNHDFEKQLLFPENATLGCSFNKILLAVTGEMRIADADVNNLIETGQIRKLSIEQIPTLGETCNEVICEQHGVAFIGMALLDLGIVPGDERAEIKLEKLQKESYNNELTLKECLVPNAQRGCPECTDFEPCHTCKHTVEQGDDCIGKWISELKDKHPDWAQDQIIAVALSKCGKARNKEEAWWWYNRSVEKYFSK